MARLPDLQFPQQRRQPWLVLAASIALHLGLLALLLFGTHVPQMAVTSARVRLSPLPVVDTRSHASRRAPTEDRTATPMVVPRHLPPASAGAVDTGSSPATPATHDADARRSTPFARLGPARASGTVWVRPLPLAPRELAARLSRSHSELADSAVTAIIQGFLDSIAMDPASKAVHPPDWTTTLGGAKFGLDSRWIYVAGLKIPTALLALLPMPAGGNDQMAFDRSDVLYRDLRQAAQRSANVADFKKAIKDIRERKEAERQFQKNQRTAPPPNLTPEDVPQ